MPKSAMFLATLFSRALSPVNYIAQCFRLIEIMATSVATSELYLHGRLTSVIYVIKKWSQRWRNLKPFLCVTPSLPTRTVKYIAVQLCTYRTGGDAQESLQIPPSLASLFELESAFHVYIVHWWQHVLTKPAKHTGPGVPRWRRWLQNFITQNILYAWSSIIQISDFTVFRN